MATVIKLPTPSKPVEDRQATCDRCRCEFSYSKQEVTDERHLLDGGWGGIGIIYRVKCPNCGYNQQVDTDYIPPK